MQYRVRLAAKAANSLSNLQKQDRQRVQAKIDLLSANPRPAGVERMTGTEFVRIRVGDYRIIYRINDQAGELDVIRIAHRSEVYRKLDRLP